MSEPIHVDITDRKHLAALWRWLTLLEHAEVLKGVPEFQKVPGYGLASALLDKQVAEEKSAAVMLNLRAVARADIDVAKVSQIHVETKADGRMRLKVIMMDLADMAEVNADG